MSTGWSRARRRRRRRISRIRRRRSDKNQGAGHNGPGRYRAVPAFSFFSARTATMSIRLYGWQRSTASRVHWALEELGVSYEYVTLDEKKGENRTPEYLAISPAGKVPGLV